MPRVAIESVDVEPAPGGLTRVTATVINQRLTPTRASADVKNNITPPDVVSISAKDLKVVLGFHHSDPFFQNATEQEHHPDQIHIDSLPGMGAVYVRWLVQSKGPFTVTVRSAKGGSDRRRVKAGK